MRTLVSLHIRIRSYKNVLRRLTRSYQIWIRVRVGTSMTFFVDLVLTILTGTSNTREWQRITCRVWKYIANLGCPGKKKWMGLTVVWSCSERREGASAYVCVQGWSSPQCGSKGPRTPVAGAGPPGERATIPAHSSAPSRQIQEALRCRLVPSIASCNTHPIKSFHSLYFFILKKSRPSFHLCMKKSTLSSATTKSNPGSKLQS